MVDSNPIQKEGYRQMELKKMLAAVRNDRIEFATMRQPGSDFATLERRVVLTGPTELVNLAGIGNLDVLDELVELLQVPDRAWAAEVLLAAMTRREEEIVDAFAITPYEGWDSPYEWWHSVGETAYERWDTWLRETREKLVWDSENKVFVEIE